MESSFIFPYINPLNPSRCNSNQLKFLVIISVDYNTYRLWELRMWSPKMKSLDVFKQILPANDIRNTWRTVRRICMLILGLKGLTRTPVGGDTGHFPLFEWRVLIQSYPRFTGSIYVVEQACSAQMLELSSFFSLFTCAPWLRTGTHGSKEKKALLIPLHVGSYACQ